MTRLVVISLSLLFESAICLYASDRQSEDKSGSILIALCVRAVFGDISTVASKAISRMCQIQLCFVFQIIDRR